MNKVLMLGSDYGSCEIINELHNRGCWVIVADYYETTPAKRIADESWLISTNDFDTLEKRCRDNNVAAVITGASDFNGGNLRVLCKRFIARMILHGQLRLINMCLRNYVKALVLQWLKIMILKNIYKIKKTIT